MQNIRKYKMDYKTFISNTTATLSIAAIVSMGSGGLNLNADNISLTSGIHNISAGISSETYNEFKNEGNINLEEEISVIIGFADKLISQSQPLDTDIAKLIDDNIMDLLS